eukprot:3591864-Pleurochrysis_carterae.AAC.1
MGGLAQVAVSIMKGQAAGKTYFDTDSLVGSMTSSEIASLDDLHGLLGVVINTGASAVATACTLLELPDYETVPPTPVLQAPVLYVSGESSATLVNGTVDLVRNLVSQLTHVVVPGNHFTFLKDGHQAVAAAVKAFRRSL